MVSNFDYYSFHNKLIIDKINKELEFYNSPENYAQCCYYVSHLKTRRGIDREEKRAAVGKKYSYFKPLETQHINMDEHMKTLDDMVFKLPWKKMQVFHKAMKIKEFIDNLTYGKKADSKAINANREYLKTEICGGLKNKRFCKNKSEVEYDEENMKIISISCLDFIKKTGLYEIDWDS